MANKPDYLSSLTDRFNFLTYSKTHLLKNSGISVAVLVLIAQLSGTVAYASSEDSDGDGLTDTYETKIGLESYLSDTDGDGIPDGDEVGSNLDAPLDSDNDSVINALDYDDDNDGLPTFLESKKDSDKDGLLDYLDTDSDNDGIVDGVEAGGLNQDKNQDGVDDAFDIMRDGAVDNNGDGIDDNVKLPDHNNDGKPDYLDGDYQHQKKILVKNNIEEETIKTKKVAEEKKPANKKSTAVSAKAIAKKKAKEAPVVTKAVSKTKQEKISTEPKPEDLVINRHTDSDNDGLSNVLEKKLGTNPLSRDSDGDKVSDAIEIGLDINSPQDSDRDGIIDAIDDDDDNDGILTKFEDLNKDSTAINDDTDGDGVPNYLDANDDGDNLLTKAEGSTADTDNDGVLDYLDKNDGIKDKPTKLAKANEEADLKEPEVVVLFDGNASSLVDDSESDDSPIQDEIVSSLDELIQTDTFDENDSDSSLQASNDDALENETSKTASKNASSHWNLF